MTPDQIQITKGVISRLEIRKKTIWQNPNPYEKPIITLSEIKSKIKELKLIINE